MQADYGGDQDIYDSGDGAQLRSNDVNQRQRANGVGGEVVRVCVVR